MSDSSIPESLNRALEALNPFVRSVDASLDWVSRKLQLQPFSEKYGELEAYHLVTSFIASDGEHRDNELLFWKGCFNDIVDPSDSFVYTEFRDSEEIEVADTWKYAPSQFLIWIASTETYSSDLELTAEYRRMAIALAKAVCNLDYHFDDDEQYDLSRFEEMLDTVLEVARSAQLANVPLDVDELESAVVRRIRERREAPVTRHETDLHASSAGRLEGPSHRANSEATGFGAGLHRVGVDISPGVYAGTGGGYWARLDVDGNILVNCVPPHGPALVEVKASDGLFESQGQWHRYSPPATAKAEFRSGAFFVGFDVELGVYRNDGDGGSIMVYSDAGQRNTLFIRNLRGSIELDLNVVGSVVVSQACGTWTRVG